MALDHMFRLPPGFMPSDTTAPSCTLTTAASATVYAAFSVTATFSETVTGFVVGDITVTNGSAGSFVAVSGSVYTFTVTPTASGTVTVAVDAGVCTDGAGNPNTAATNLTRIKASAYANNILTNHATGLIGLWTCYQNSNDSSVEANNGADVGSPSYAATGIGDGNTAVLFDGATNAIQIGSAGLGADINYNIGSASVWAKRTQATVGTDYIIALYFSPNRIVIEFSSTNVIFTRKDDTSTKTVSVANTSTAWQHLLLTWDTTAGANGEMKAFVDGAQVGTTQQAHTNTGTMVQAWTMIGAQNNTLTVPFDGSCAHVALWAGVVKASDAVELATVI